MFASYIFRLRPLRLLLLVSLLSSFMPTSTMRATPASAAHAAPPARTVASLPQTMPSIPRPPGAYSTSLSPSVVDQLRQQYESSHTLHTPAADRSDAGSFSTPSIETYAIADSFTLDGSSVVTTTLVIPAGVTRDSMMFDLSLTAYQYYGAGAFIAFRAVGASAWTEAEAVWDTPGTTIGGPPVSTNVSQKSVSFGSTVPTTTSLELLLGCIGNSGSPVTCTWSNLRFFHDMPGWHAPLFSRPSDWFTARITAEPFDGISPSAARGAFLALRNREAGSGARYFSYATYRSQEFTLPQMAASDVLTGSVWWARTFTGENFFGDSGDAVIDFVAEDGSMRLRVVDVPATNTLDPSDWTFQQSVPVAAGDVLRASGKHGYFEITKRLGGSDHTLALDSMTLYVNGQSIGSRTIPVDQVAGKCQCAAGDAFNSSMAIRSIRSVARSTITQLISPSSVVDRHYPWNVPTPRCCLILRPTQLRCLVQVGGTVLIID